MSAPGSTETDNSTIQHLRATIDTKSREAADAYATKADLESKLSLAVKEIETLRSVSETVKAQYTDIETRHKQTESRLTEYDSALQKLYDAELATFTDPELKAKVEMLSSKMPTIIDKIECLKEMGAVLIHRTPDTPITNPTAIDPATGKTKTPDKPAVNESQTKDYLKQGVSSTFDFNALLTPKQ